MHIELPKPGTFLTTQQISEAQIKLGMTVDRIMRSIETAQNKIADTKKEIASRWKKTFGISAADANKLAQRETSAKVREIMDDVIGSIEEAHEHAKDIYEEICNAKAFYPGKLQFLMNATIMSETRARYAAALTLAGPVELAGYAAYAIGVQDTVMAAAVIQANDALPAKERRFHSVAVSERINIPAWDSLQAAIKLADVLSEQIEVAVRTFRAGKSSPIDTIRLAMLGNDMKPKDTDQK